MSEVDQLNQQLNAIPLERREALAAQFREQAAAQEESDWTDSLTPEQRAWLKAELEEAIAEADRGETEPWDYEQFLADARARNNLPSAE